MSTLRLCGAALAAALLSGCAGDFVPPDPIGRALFGYRQETVVYQPREVAVTTVMPAPRYRRVYVRPAPYSNAVWIDGQWYWRGNRWAWRDGYWTRRPRAGAVWVNSSYYERGGGRYWRSGYWR